MTIQASTTVLFSCDNPSCSNKFAFNQADVQKDQNALPKAAWRVLTVVTFTDQRHTFCGKPCLLDFMRTFQYPKSPQEATEEMQANMQKAKIEVPAPITSPQVLVEQPEPWPQDLSDDVKAAQKKLVQFPAGPVPQADGAGV